MPRYNYKCVNCGEVWEDSCKISEYDLPLKSPCKFCGSEDSVIIHHESAPMLIDPVNTGHQKLPTGFDQVLSNISKKTGQPLNHSFSTRREI